MRDDVKRALMLGFLAGVVGLSPGCATSSATGQVQELEPGTYSVGISRTTSYLAEGDKAIASAVDKAGALGRAHGGTIFFDEIAAMRREHQAKVLRVIEGKAFRRVR